MPPSVQGGSSNRQACDRGLVNGRPAAERLAFRCERALRGVAVGRKAWLFAGSDRGDGRAACRLRGQSLPAGTKGDINQHSLSRTREPMRCLSKAHRRHGDDSVDVRAVSQEMGERAAGTVKHDQMPSVDVEDDWRKTRARLHRVSVVDNALDPEVGVSLRSALCNAACAIGSNHRVPAFIRHTPLNTGRYLGDSAVFR